MAERRKTVFISYAHQDRKWADELLTHLAPWIREKRVNLWDDSRIKAGDQWHSEIRKALGEGVRSQRDTAERTVEAAKAAVQARATESTKEADVPVVRAHPMYYHALARVVGGHQSWTNLMRDDLIRDVIAPIVTGQLFPVNYDEGRALMNAARPASRTRSDASSFSRSVKETRSTSLWHRTSSSSGIPRLIWRRGSEDASR